MTRAAVDDARVRRQVADLAVVPQVLAAWLPEEADPVAVERGRRVLLRHLDGPHPLETALDAAAHDLPPGDEALVVLFWARSAARCQGVALSFDAAGLDRLRSKS